MLRQHWMNTSRVIVTSAPEGGDAAGDDPTPPAAAAAGAEVSGTGTDAGGADVEADAADGGDTDVEDDAAADDMATGSDTGDDDDDGELDLEALDPKVRARVERELRWRDRQIDRQHRKLKDREADLETLRAIQEGRLKPDGEPVATDENGQPVYSEAEVQRRAAEQAKQISTQEQFDARCNEVFADGKNRFKDNWEKSLARLPKLGGIDADTMVNILATDDPALVVYTMARNPDTYQRIMDLPPARRFNEFVKLAIKKEPKAASKAPPPVNPVQSARGASAAQRVDLYDDKVSDDEWYRKRNAERRRKFSAA